MTIHILQEYFGLLLALLRMVDACYSLLVLRLKMQPVMYRASRESKLDGLAARLNQPVWYWTLAILLAGFYIVTSWYISAHRLLWFDEIFTAIICRQPSVKTMWSALRDGVDQIPVLYFLVARFFDQLLHRADIGIRIPSILALGAGLLVTFDVARRLTDTIGGLITMSLLSTSYATYYGYEARPYAICFMLAAVALWLWVATDQESKSAAVAFGAVFLIGGTVHYYFLACLVPFGIFALAQRRIFHPKVVAATVGAIGSLSVLYPQILSSLTKVHSGVFNSWAAPSLGKIQLVYVAFFPSTTLPLAIFAAGLAVFGSSRVRRVPPMSEGERIGWLFLVIPLAVYVMARLVTHFFVDRYMIGTVPGIAVAATCLFWRHFRESRYVTLSLLLALGGYGAFQQLLTVGNIAHIDAYGDHQRRTREILAVEDLLQRDGKRLFAMTSNLPWLEAWYYSKYPKAYGLYWPAAMSGSTLEKYAPVKLLSVNDIVANAAQTALIAPDNRLLAELERAGLHPKVHFSNPWIFYLE
jgi:hypothetical protein